MGNQRVYLAGPLGFSELGRTGQTEIVRILTSNGFVPIDPFALAPIDEITRINALSSLDAQREAWRALNFRIGESNARAIGACDAVLAILDGPDVDSGTAAEIGYAFARGKPIVGYRGDFRLAADNIGSIVNLQVEYFIAASGGAFVTMLDSIPAALARTLQSQT